MQPWLSLSVFGVGALLSGVAVGLRAPEPVDLVFISVGQGDGAVLQVGGEAILIDDGPNTPSGNAGEKLVLPELRALGVDDVQAILLSHPDGDHVGGTPAILAAYPDAKVVMSDQFEHDAAMSKHLASWGLPPSRVAWLGRDDGLRFGPFTARIECPDMSPGDEANNGSMFLRVSCGRGSAVFSGDAPASVERDLEGFGPWGSEILKVGHHGSRTASDPTWIAAVRPRYAVISVGRRNMYGHPNREVLDRLSAAGVRVFRTDTDGTVVFRFEGGEFVPEVVGRS